MLYHIRISKKPYPYSTEYNFDITKEQLENRFLNRFNQGQNIVINGKTVQLKDIEQIEIFETPKESIKLGGPLSFSLETHELDKKRLWKNVSLAGKNITSDLITTPYGVEYQNKEDRMEDGVKDKRIVFVIHGRDSENQKAMFDFLRSIDLKPLEWAKLVTETGEASPHISNILEKAFNTAQAVVALMTPDDLTILNEKYQKPNDPPYEKKLTPQARPNVLFEAGVAFGSHPKRTVIVEIGELRPFSDISGRYIIKFNNSSKKRQEIAKQLERAGCPVDLNGTDWHSTGNFVIPNNKVMELETEKIEHESVNVKDEFYAILGRYKIEWEAEKESQPTDIEDGKYILDRLCDELLNLREIIYGKVKKEIISSIDERIKESKIIQKHELRINGGKSYREFWEYGDILIDKIKNTVDKIK